MNPCFPSVSLASAEGVSPPNTERSLSVLSVPLHFRNPALRRETMNTQPLLPAALSSARFSASVLLAALATAFASSAWAFESGSTGADGAFAPTVNTVVTLPPSGVLNYTTVNIPVGVTVSFQKNALNTPVYLLASGNVTVAGTIQVSGSTAAAAGTAGGGVLADDGNPGVGGPGGFDGGRGGRADVAQTPTTIRGGAGLGPGGGDGGTEGGDSCLAGRLYQKFVGESAGHETHGNPNAPVCGGTFTNSGGVPYGSAILQPLIGGSGGGGGRGGTVFAGSGGGGGGGALLIASSGTVSIPTGGAIYASGGNGGDVGGSGFGGPGGGGSGGAIRIVATTLTGAGIINAARGATNAPTSGTSYINNASTYYASVGRIRLEAETFTYTAATTPPFSRDAPGPVFLANVPSLRIATVGGQTVPANPTGQADLTFPANLTNPVTVAFETTNVPAGNTVLLRVIPASGAVVEALSPAITVSGAAGSASVQVSLPQGPSVLQAVTTYTVVVAMGNALSHFAQNERVEKVQLIATLGGESQAKLITVSGKEYVVPAAVLQSVGLAG